MLSLVHPHNEIAVSLFAFIGLLIGSFLNVVIYRLPLGKSLLFPRSHCPSCEKTISWWENIPVVSWVFLRGKCRSCHTRIAFRYPLVEILSALLSGMAAWQYGATIQAGLLSLFLWALLALTYIDFDHLILPDKIVKPLLVLGILISFWHGAPSNLGLHWTENIGIPAVSHHAIGWIGWPQTLYAAALGYWILALPVKIYARITGVQGMGAGDWKLLAAVGAWFGYSAILWTIFVGSILGTGYGIALALRHPEKKGEPFPFGPMLAIAAGMWGLFPGIGATLFPWMGISY